jgi:hypothetical protein
VADWFSDLEALRRWALAARPVFICGQERSGTSALLLALARHPALFAVPHVFETFIFAAPQDLLAATPRPMQLAYLRGSDRLAALRECLRVLGGGDAATLSGDDLIRAFFAFAATEVYPGQRPLEKTPSHVFRLDRVFALFPNARVLACVREPSEVVDSYRYRLQRELAAGKTREACAWLDLTDTDLVRRFREVDQALRTAATKQAPGQLFQVPYAWLTADAPKALRAICRFIGESFEPAMLTPRAGARERIDERLGQPIGATDEVRPSTLSPEAQASLRRRTGGLMRRWRVPGVIAPDAPEAER